MIGLRHWLVLVALLALALIGSLYSPDDADEVSTLGSRLGLKAADVNHLEAGLGATSGVALNRLGSGGWRLNHAGNELGADPRRVARLLDVLRAGTLADYALGDVDMARLGLDPGQAWLRFDDVRLRIGGQEPVGGGRYVLAGDHVYVIYADDLIDLIRAGKAAFVDQRLLGGARIVRLELPGMVVERKGEAWRSSPESKQVGALVLAWNNARARWVEFTDSNDSDERGKLAALVELDDGRRVVFYQAVDSLNGASVANALHDAQRHLTYYLDMRVYSQLLGGTDR